MIKHHSYSFICDSDGRLDAIAASALSISRSVFSKDGTSLKVNGRSAKKSQKIKNGDEVAIEYDEDVFEGLEAEALDLNILYEDDDILVIDKAQGMSVHPGSGCANGTVANALLSMYGDDFSVGDDDIRPGIVHRLDKDTSGVMVIAKNDNALKNLSLQFAEHTNEKYYIALVKGEFSIPTGEIDKRIKRDPQNRKRFTVTDNKSEGKSALTKYRVLCSKNGYSLLKIRIFTGRTHQIRVHLSSIMHPVLGDPIYSKRDSRFPDATLMLNSAKLTIAHPATGKKMSFSSRLPERFKLVMDALGMDATDTMPQM